MNTKLLTVIELPPYLRAADGILSEDERKEVVNTIAADPECGDVMQGTGGVRKKRFALGNKGKSGGARVIYYFYNETKPAFLLTVFSKSQRSNLKAEEKNALRLLVADLIKSYGK